MQNDIIKPLSFEIILAHVKSLDIQPTGMYQKESLISQMLLPKTSNNGSLCLISPKYVIKSPNGIESFRFSLDDGDVKKPFTNFSLLYGYNNDNQLVFQHADELIWLGQHINILQKNSFQYEYKGETFEDHIFYKKLQNDNDFCLKIRNEIKTKFLWKLALTNKF